GPGQFFTSCWPGGSRLEGGAAYFGLPLPVAAMRSLPLIKRSLNSSMTNHYPIRCSHARARFVKDWTLCCDLCYLHRNGTGPISGRLASAACAFSDRADTAWRGVRYLCVGAAE